MSENMYAKAERMKIDDKAIVIYWRGSLLICENLDDEETLKSWCQKEGAK